MEIVLITGAGGLIGSETAYFFHGKGYRIIGVDNNMRKKMYGHDGDISWRLAQLNRELRNYEHHDIDFRNKTLVEKILARYKSNIALIVHAGAQPSHDWAARYPAEDYSINASGTFEMLEAARKYCPEAVFVFTSTNKVYGDHPNSLPFDELESRYEISKNHRYADGIDENMSIDQTTHSIFGASKVAADILVQEYGRYFGMKTACFRGGCLTGPGHSGVQEHGFLAFLAKCCMSERPYRILGYKGKQVRDNIHSYDFANAIYHFFKNPNSGEVYNIGGGRHSNCSVLEAIALCEQKSGKKMNVSYDEQHRTADHIWWISDMRKFRNHYPGWQYRYGIEDIIGELIGVRKIRKL